MSRILFFGDLGATGFGTVTRDLGKGLLDLGHDLRFMSHYSADEGSLEEPFRSRTVNVTSLVRNSMGATEDIREQAIRGCFTGTTAAPLASGEPWGDWTPEAAIILGDFLVVRLFMAPLADEFRSLPSYHYVPIEGVALPPRWGEVWATAKPIAMSEFGADEIAKVTGQRPPVAYHGVDTDVFRQVSRTTPIILSSENKPPNFLTSKAECKEAWIGLLAEQNHVTKIPRHWMLRVDRHWPRKRYNALLRSLMPALARHPDWGLVIHCAPWDQGGNLVDELSKYPRRYREQVLLTGGPILPRNLLASLYNAADLYVSNSAEGFGLTIAEALSCGVPALGVRYSSVPEVIGPAGRTVAEGYLIDNEYDHFWWAADEEAFGKAAEGLMTHQMQREDLGRKGPLHVAANFRWERAAQVFSEQITADLTTREAQAA